MNSAVLRYRVMAYATGVGLLALVFVGMPLKYFADQAGVVAVVGPIHGFLYIVYLVTGLDLCVRNRWSLWRTLLVLVAGTVPFLSFVVERLTARWLREERSVEPVQLRQSRARR